MATKKLLKVGDRVGVNYDGYNGTGVIRRVEEENNRYWIMRDDNGSEWFVLMKDSYIWSLEKPKEAKPIKATPENTVNVSIERRDNGRTYFTFQVPAKITELYKARSQEVKESKNWVGIKFYAIPELLADKSYQDRLKSFNLFDNFGDAFVKVDGGAYKLNIAWIRAIEGAGEFEVANELGHSELNLMVKNMLGFLKNYFEDYFKSFTIKGSLTIDF